MSNWESSADCCPLDFQGLAKHQPFWRDAGWTAVANNESPSRTVWPSSTKSIQALLTLIDQNIWPVHLVWDKLELHIPHSKQDTCSLMIYSTFPPELFHVGMVCILLRLLQKPRRNLNLLFNLPNQRYALLLVLMARPVIFVAKFCI